MTIPTMKPRLLQICRYPGDLGQRLAAAYDVKLLAEEADPAAYLAAHGGEFVAVATSAAFGITNEQVAALLQLRVISSYGVGLDKIDVAFAASRGVVVGYTPEVLNDCVADLAFALLLDIARGLSAGDRYVRRGDWGRAGGAPFPLQRKVSGARLGIVGLGRIGRTIARRASGFEMDLRYHSRRPVEDVAWTHEPSLKALAGWADYLVVITAGGAATRHLIDEGVLEALGPEGFLINVSRGTVVDEAALVRALQQRRIAGAALDVFEREPKVPAELFALDNVVLLPHVASATRETRQAMADLVVENLRSFFADGRLKAQAPRP